MLVGEELKKKEVGDRFGLLARREEEISGGEEKRKKAKDRKGEE